MRYSILIGLVLSFVFVLPAQAEPFARGVYSTFGYAAVFPVYKGSAGSLGPSMLNGFEIGVGYQLNRHYGVEAVYTDASGSSFVGLRVQSFALSGMGYAPLGKRSRIALFSNVGAGIVISDAGFGSSTAFGLHLGGGVLWQPTDQLGLRASVLYQWADFTAASGAAVIGLDVLWRV